MDHDIVIVGGGFSGIAVAIELMKHGRTDFVILEKADELGGTWRDNTYPGCACDVPSALYSLSFAPNPGWSRVFAQQPEIQAYLLDVAERFGVRPHVQFGTEVQDARWTGRHWVIETSRGEVTARALVAGTGPLHVPVIPDLPGLESFEGVAMHSARWRDDVELSGKRVAVVGTGSSSIQITPAIQPQVGQLTLFQRTAAWVLPKPDHAIPWVEEAAFRYIPGAQSVYRAAWYYGLELLQWAQRKPERMHRVEQVALTHMHRQVDDPELREVLTPDWTLGCKRLLLSNHFYPALQEDNVHLVPHGVVAVGPDWVEDATGARHEVDVIVFATGFEVTNPPVAKRVRRADGASLADLWEGSPQAYLGTMVPGFPNFFLTLGPNLGNGHSSALTLVEAQATYIANALDTLDEHQASWLSPKPPITDDWNEQLQDALEGTVWNAGGCASWYLSDDGSNRTIYPWSTIDLRRRLRRIDLAAYDLGRQVVAITGGARGIGRATAEAFLAEGYPVVIGDIDLDVARQTAEAIGAHALPLDVTDASSMDRFVETIERDHGPIGVFVNNAGLMATADFVTEDRARARAQIDVNYWGVVNGLQAVLPRMKARGRGHVVNIASIGGKITVAGMATYIASKHAVIGLSGSVRHELDGTGVSLSTVMPTAVRTRLAGGIDLSGLMAQEPEDVAVAVLESLTTKQAEIAVPRWLSAYTPINWALPERARDWVRRRLQSKRALEAARTGVRRIYEEHIAAK